MHTIGTDQSLHLAVGSADTVNPTMQRVIFVGFDEDALLLDIEAQYLLHYPWTASDGANVPSCYRGISDCSRRAGSA